MTDKLLKSVSAKLARFGEKMNKFVHDKPWWVIIGTAIIVFFLGSSGVIWDYLGYSLDERRDYRESVELARQLQSDMTAIQKEIIDFAPKYLAVRDVRNDDGEYVLGNEHVLAATRLIKLVSDYNRLEARRSFVEETQPRWFPIGPMIPPMAPKGLEFTPIETVRDGKVLMNVTWDNNYDKVLAGVRDDLKRVYEEYDLEYPSAPIPEVK